MCFPYSSSLGTSSMYWNSSVSSLFVSTVTFTGFTLLFLNIFFSSEVIPFILFLHILIFDFFKFSFSIWLLFINRNDVEYPSVIIVKSKEYPFIFCGIEKYSSHKISLYANILSRYSFLSFVTINSTIDFVSNCIFFGTIEVCKGKTWNVFPSRLSMIVFIKIMYFRYLVGFTFKS